MYTHYTLGSKLLTLSNTHTYNTSPGVSSAMKAIPTRGPRARQNNRPQSRPEQIDAEEETSGKPRKPIYSVALPHYDISIYSTQYVYSSAITSRVLARV